MREDEDNRDIVWKESMTGCLWYVMGIAVGLLFCALLGSCGTTKYVPVVEHRTEHHWHTDTVRQRDSTHTEHETIIREVDSAAMAKYGIQMQVNQRAWLVLQREMENRLREMEHMAAQRDTVHDSIPAPYPVEKLVEKELTWWQKLRIDIANILLWAVAILGVAGIVKLIINNSKFKI